MPNLRYRAYAHRTTAKRSAADKSSVKNRETRARGSKEGSPCADTAPAWDHRHQHVPAKSWEHILQTTKEHDKHTVDAWKDDISNLLIVTGLFSSVVSAFTVQSNLLLQSPPVDLSAQLLAQISRQLSGLPFLNSSAIPTPQLNLDDSYPSHVAVNVNITWVTSLTLSLLVALFALAVQQWLRHSHVSTDVSPRTALRLRQLRHESLRTWQVPGIISFLPVVLQIAVVLFLVGLMLLLASLNDCVAVAFELVTGCGLALFLTSSLIPLFNVRCAYKSALMPTVFIVLQWTTYPAALLATLLYALPAWTFKAIPLRLSRRFPRAYFKYLHQVYWPGQQLVGYIRSFGTHMRVDLRTFWSNKELRAVVEDTDLDCRALISALVLMRDGLLSRVKGRILEYEPSTRMRGALLVVIRTLGFHRAQDVLQYYPQLSGNNRLRDRARYCIPARHVELLLDTLPTEWASGDPLEELDTARILYLAYHATRAAHTSCRTA